MMSFAKISPGVAGVGSLVLGCLLIAGAVEAQDIRYFGRATGKINADGSANDDSCAGTGKSADVNNPCIPEKTCDQGLACCFDVPEPGDCGARSTIPASRTFGGAALNPAAPPRPAGCPTAPAGPRPDGFPFVRSDAKGSERTLGPNAELRIIPGDATTIADSFDGALCAVATCSVVFVAGNPDPLQLCQGEERNLGAFTIQAGAVTRRVEDGFSIIAIDATVCRDNAPVNNVCGTETRLGHAEAGLEIPFTTGGGVGCSLSRGGRGSGGATLIGMLGFFWLVARRRRLP